MAQLVLDVPTARLYQGDALAVLAELPTASVDALITDPPYSSGGMVRGDRMATTHVKYVQNDSVAGHALHEFTGDNRDQRGYAYWCALWLSECVRIVRPGGFALLFSDWRQLPTTTDALQAGGFIWRGIVPWHKPTARPQAGRFTASCEYVVWGSNGPLPVDFTAAVLPGFYQASPPRSDRREHITQKPLAVMRSMVRIIPAGATVLDPFTGSGTTGIAAALEGRHFVGVELDGTHATTAAERIGAAVAGRPRGPAEQLMLGDDTDAAQPVGRQPGTRTAGLPAPSAGVLEASRICRCPELSGCRCRHAGQG